MRQLKNQMNNSKLMQTNVKETSLTWLALFTTTGTLVCCAIPIILVTLGMGATLASLVGTLPFLITLSLHKVWVFSISGLMLALSAWFIYRRSRSCPVDAELGALCEKSQVWNRRVYWFSVILWSIGFFAAFLALPLQIWFDGFN
jgi:mercuric ion transport protein